MYSASFKSITVFAGWAIASLAFLSPTQAQSPPTPANGLNSSYVGVAVDASGVLGLGQEYFQQSSSPAQWFFNQAVSASQASSTSATSSVAGLDGRAFQGRLNLGILPISIRGKVSLGSEANVVQPILSYDLAIARNTNFYAGAGYSFFSSREKSSATNNQDAFFVIAGAEAAVSDKVIVYGDAQYPLNQLDLKSATPVKVQVGIGFRF
jgi:opacity protein-like surface antigen